MSYDVNLDPTKMDGKKTTHVFQDVRSMRCLSIPVRCGEAEVGNLQRNGWKFACNLWMPVPFATEMMRLRCAKRHFMQDAFKGQVSVSCAPSISNLKTVKGSWQRSAPTFGMARSLVSGIPWFGVCSGLYSKEIVNRG